MENATVLARAAVLRILLVERRKQSTISMLESGQRRIEVVEFMAMADALEFDPTEVIRQLRKTKATSLR
jgi:hypothetical protein